MRDYHVHHTSTRTRFFTCPSREVKTRTRGFVLFLLSLFSFREPPTNNADTPPPSPVLFAMTGATTRRRFGPSTRTVAAAWRGAHRFLLLWLPPGCVEKKHSWRVRFLLHSRVFFTRRLSILPMEGTLSQTP